MTINAREMPINARKVLKTVPEMPITASEMPITARKVLKTVREMNKNSKHNA